MLLKWSGLNEEQQAVVKGRSMGVLKREEISRAMRSCYPDFVNNRRKAVALVQDEVSEPTDIAVTDDEVTGFNDVELFIADYVKVPEDEEVYFPEEEVAEVLATSWKDKRAEINRLQKARRFDQAKDLRRSFRVEIEEMKKKTRCNRCNKVGHWARECRQKREPASSSNSGLNKSASKENAASYVAPEPIEQPAFVAAVEPQRSLLQQLRDHRAMASSQPEEVLLVSSPGYAVLDSGCGKTIIGRQTLDQFAELWRRDDR